MAGKIEAVFDFLTLEDSKEILHYEIEKLNPGIWKPMGEILIEKAIYHYDHKISRQGIGEILNKIKIFTYTNRKTLNNPKYLAVKNFVIDLDNLEILEHNKDYRLTRYLPLKYDEQAKCPQIEKFISDISEVKEMEKTLYELIGYCLINKYDIQKAFMLVGNGANGKSTFISLLRNFLGQDNVRGIELVDLVKDKWYKAELYNKLANLAADLPTTMLRDTSLFKSLTGGDLIEAQKKNRDPFNFVNTCKLIFSCNELPATLDESDAYYRRWIIFNFNKQFLGKNADKNLLEKLTTENELSGLLNKALEGLQRLIINKEFTMQNNEEDIKAKREEYIKKSDSVKSFSEFECERDIDSEIEKEEFYDAYKLYCTKIGVVAKQTNIFYRNIKIWLPGLIATRPERNGIRIRCLKGIKLINLESENL
jgi:putative DNA primase/helicase